MVDDHGIIGRILKRRTGVTHGWSPFNRGYNHDGAAFFKRVPGKRAPQCCSAPLKCVLI
jgi:hypothetical protein